MSEEREKRLETNIPDPGEGGCRKVYSGSEGNKGCNQTPGSLMLVHSLPLELFLSQPEPSEQASMDLWNWDEASLQEVPPGDKLTGLGKLLRLGTNCMQGSEDANPLTPNRALTPLLPAEGAEFGFYFPEVALQGDTPITPMNVESCWKGGCWA